MFSIFNNLIIFFLHGDLVRGSMTISWQVKNKSRGLNASTKIRIQDHRCEI